MILLDAIAAILQDAAEPLTQQDITRRVLERNLWTTNGKTPDATVGARLYVDIKKHGPDSRFKQAGKGLFALREWDIPAYSAPPKPPIQPKTPTPAPKPHTAATLSFTDATEKILERFGNKKPLHYRDITKRALKLKWIHTAGLKPEATLYSQVITEIQRKTKRGETPRFVTHGKGMIGLRKWMGTGLAYQISQHNTTVGKKLRSQLYEMQPGAFEALIVNLLNAIGFEDVTMTPPSGDGGIDVRATLVVGDVIRTRMAIQAKRWKKNVQSFIVQQVRGSLGTHEQGLIITTSDYSAGARTEAQRANAVPVALMNGEQLVKLLVENDIGVHRTSYPIFELGPAEPE